MESLGLKISIGSYEDLDRCVSLLLMQQEKYGRVVQPAELRQRLETAWRAAPTTLLLLTRSSDASHVVSFSFLSRIGDTWHAMFTGTDYADKSANNAYFETVYYASVERAHSFGVSIINFGYGSERAKTLRGCALHPINAWLLPLSEDSRSNCRAMAQEWRDRYEFEDGRL